MDDTKKQILQAKKKRLDYAKKRAKELGVKVEEYISSRKEKREEVQALKIKRAKVRSRTQLVSGKAKPALEACTVFVEISYRDIQVYGKFKKPNLKEKQDRLDYENILMDQIETSCLKKLKTANLLNKYSQPWEGIGNVTIYNFDVKDAKKAFSLIKRHFKQKLYLKKFKIYSYGYYSDSTQVMLANETVINE